MNDVFDLEALENMTEPPPLDNPKVGDIPPTKTTSKKTLPKKPVSKPTEIFAKKPDVYDLASLEKSLDSPPRVSLTRPKQSNVSSSIDSKIDDYSTRNGVDANFTRAVMGQESGGKPNAKSWANAGGLLQILPDTGKAYRKDFDPYNVDHNLDVGTRHLAYLIKRYKGDKKRALAAYNAGEGNADKNNWYEKSQYWSNDPDVQKGLKPRGPSDKTNTRNYVDKIYGNYERMSGNAGATPWQPSAVTPSGAPAVNFEAGDYVKASYPYSTEEYAAFERLKGNKTSAKSLSKQAQIPSEVLTDSVGNQYFSASQDGVPEGYTRVKSTNLSTKEERTFLIDKDRNVLPEVRPGVPMNPNMRYDMKGNEYSFKEDLPDGTKRFERIGENGQPQTFIFNKDGSIKQEGVTTTPDWVLGQTPGKSPLPNDKAVQMIHERLLKAGAKDSEEMRQRLIRGYNDKMSGKTPTMFNPEEIAMLEDLQNKIEIAEAQGQPTPPIVPQEQQNLRQAPVTADPQGLKTPAPKIGVYKIPVDVSGYDGENANRKAAEQAVKASGKIARGKTYDAIETQVIVDHVEKTRGAAAVRIADGGKIQYSGKGDYTITAENMAENEKILELNKAQIDQVRFRAMAKFIESTQDVTEDNIQSLRDLGFSDQDIYAAVYGSGNEPSLGIPLTDNNPRIDEYAQPRQQRELHKAFYEQQFNKYHTKGIDSPFVAGLKAYRDIGVVTDEEVEKAVKQQAELRNVFRNSQDYANKSTADKFWQSLTEIPEGIQYFLTEANWNSNEDLNINYLKRREILRNQEVRDFIKEQEGKWGSLARYQEFLDLNKDQEKSVVRQGKQFFRTVGNLAIGGGLKTLGVLDNVLEGLYTQGPGDDYLLSLRNAANWTSYLASAITGSQAPDWVKRGGTVEENPFYKVGGEFQKWLGEDEYLASTLSGKINSALASGLTFLAGGLALKGMKYGAGMLGVLSQVGSTYDDLRRKGMSPQEAKYWALGIGVPLGFSEQWGIGGTGKRALSRLGSELTNSQFKIMSRSMWDFAKTTNKIGSEEFLEEFLQEWGQSTFGQSAVNAVTAQDKTAGEKVKKFFNDIPKQAGESLGDAVIAGLSGYALGTGSNAVIALVNRGREKSAILEDEQQRNINITLWNNKLKIDGQNFPITEEITPLATRFTEIRKEIVPLQRQKYELIEKSRNGEEVNDEEFFGIIEKIAELSTEQQLVAEEIAKAAGMEVVPSAITGEYKQSDLNIPDIDFAPTDEMPDDVNEWADEANPGKQQIGMDFGEETGGTVLPTANDKPVLRDITGEVIRFADGTEGLFVGFKNGKAIIDHSKKGEIYQKRDTFELGDVYFQGTPLSEYSLDEETPETAKPVETKTVEPFWMVNEKTGERIKISYNDDIGEYIWKKPGTTDQLESSAKLPVGWVRESTKPPEFQERPPVDVSVAEQRRADEKFTQDGVTYNRQKPDIAEKALLGKKGTVKFSNKEAPEFQYALIEADELQPADLGGNPNYNHFLPEAQPKDRSGKASAKASDEMAQDIRFYEVGENPLAYSGAPVVNERGEVIQGNNRAEGIKKSYGLGNSYKQQLEKESERFGFSKKEFKDRLKRMKNPVVVRMVRATDEDAIRLGNYTQSDIETGAGIQMNVVATASRIPYTDQMAMIRNIFNGADPSMTLNQVIRANIDRVADGLKKYITDEQFKSLFKDKSFEFTSDGVKLVENLFKQFLFSKGIPELGKAFENLPQSTQDVITGSIPVIFSVPQDKNLVPEIQSAIIIAHQFTDTGIGDFEVWKRQADMLSGSRAPIDIFYPIELHLAQFFLETKRTKEVREELGKYALAINGERDMFGEVKGLSKPEAIEKVFGVVYFDAPRIENNEKETEQTSNTDLETSAEQSEGIGQQENGEPQPQSEGEKGTTEVAAEPEQENVSETEKPEQGTSERLPEKLAEPGLGEPQVIEPTATATKGKTPKWEDLTVGAKIIVSEQVDYLRPGVVFEIIEVTQKQMRFEGLNGGKTYVRNGLIVKAIREGILTLAQEDAVTETPTVDEPAKEAANSPTNDLPEPTEGQKEAGNYKKGHVVINGLDVTIENPVGSKRTGTDKDGETWSVTMKSHYGYIKRTEGADGEHIDLFIKEGTPLDYNGEVYVIDQIEPTSGEFDEHKIMFGYASEKEAREAYLENYAKDWKGLDSITPMGFEMFRNWTKEVQETPAVETTKEKSEVRTEEVAEVMQPLKKDEVESMFDDWLEEDFGPTEEPEPVVADTADEFDKTVEKVYGQIDFTPKMEFIADTKVLGQKVKIGESEVVIAEEQEKIRQQTSILESLLNCVKTP